VINNNLAGSTVLIAVLFSCLLATSAVAQDKVIIGVGEITSNVGSANPQNFQTMLETLLVQTNKFDVIERSRLDEVFSERGLSMAGVTDRYDGISGIEGVDYLIYGAITKLGESAKQTNFLVAGLNKSDKKYEMAVDLRIVDVDTGKMVLADTVEISSASQGSFTVAGLQGFGGVGQSGQEGDPLSDVQRLAAVEIAGVITTTISPIKVATVQSDGTIILNYGESVLRNEEFVKVFRPGEGFTDPDTGEVLGAEEIEVGILQVEDAVAKYSKAKLAMGNTPEVGDVARKLDEDEAKQVEKAVKKARKKR
jgi:curli biogenesis system outer membrane secretion channel CsgG